MQYQMLAAGGLVIYFYITNLGPWILFVLLESGKIPGSYAVFSIFPLLATCRLHIPEGGLEYLSLDISQ